MKEAESADSQSEQGAIGLAILNRYFQGHKNSMGYKLFLPHLYEDLQDTSFPLILFLHGVRKRGSDLHLLDGYGLTHIAEQSENFPCIVVAPQCPSDTVWPEHRDTVLHLLSEVIEQFRVDRQSVYVTGFSMGANGVWDLAANTEGVFAAAVPLAGWYEPQAASRLTSIPIWTFHGEDDDDVPISKTEEIVNAIKNAGSTPKFTRYPGFKHFIMDVTYTNPELYKWLLENKRR